MRGTVGGPKAPSGTTPYRPEGTVDQEGFARVSIMLQLDAKHHRCIGSCGKQHYTVYHALFKNISLS